MSYIGKNPTVSDITLSGTDGVKAASLVQFTVSATAPGSPAEGMMYYNDGTGAISEGLKVYKNGNFVGIDKQLGDADTIALKKAVDVGGLQWTVAINSTSTTVGMNDPIPQYNATATGFVSTTAFSNTSTGDALLTDESADLVFAYKAHALNCKNDYYGIQIDVPKAFRGGNLVLEFEYRTAEASGATSDDDFRVAVQDHTNKAQTFADTGMTGSKAAGTSILVDSSAGFAVGDKVWVESGTGNSGVQANDFTEAYVTAIADATHLTFSETIIFPASSGGLIASGWLTPKVGGQLAEADSDTNKVGKKRSIQFITEETTATVNVTFQNLSTSAAGIDLFVDNILLSANKFLQASSQTKSECYYAKVQDNLWDHTGGAHCSAWDISLLVPQSGSPPIAQSRLLDIETGATTADQTNITAREDIVLSIQVGGNVNSVGMVSIKNSSDEFIARWYDGGGSASSEPSCNVTVSLAKGDFIYAYQQDSSTSYTKGSMTITATPQVNDVIILESQDEIFTDWVDYTSELSTVGPANSTNTGTDGTYGTYFQKIVWRRIGDTMDVRWSFRQSTAGTASTGMLSLPLPSGYSIDIAKLHSEAGGTGTFYSGYNMNGANLVGHGKNSNAVDGFSAYCGPLYFYAMAGATNTLTTAVVMTIIPDSGGHLDDSENVINGAEGNTFNNMMVFQGSFKVPISGWNANFNPLLSMPLVDLGQPTEFWYNGWNSGVSLWDGTGSQYTWEKSWLRGPNLGDAAGTIGNSNFITVSDITSGTNTVTAVTAKQDITLSMGMTANLTAGQEIAVWDHNDVNIFRHQQANSTYVTPCTVDLNLRAGEYIYWYAHLTQAYGNVWIKATRLQTGNMAHIIKPAVAFIKDVKPYNIGGGTPGTTGFLTRDLNTVEGESWFVTLDTSKFTLDPGTYKITSMVPNYNGNYCVQILWDEDNSRRILQGPQAFAYDYSDTQNTMVGLITIGTSTEFSIKQRVSNNGGDAWGVSNPYDTVGVAIYTVVMIEKLK